MAKLISALVGLSALGLVGAANAAEPVNLTEAQMDQVTAGTWIFMTHNTWIPFGQSFLLLQAGKSYWYDDNQILPGSGGGGTVFFKKSPASQAVPIQKMPTKKT